MPALGRPGGGARARRHAGSGEQPRHPPRGSARPWRLRRPTGRRSPCRSAGPADSCSSGVGTTPSGRPSQLRGRPRSSRRADLAVAPSLDGSGGGGGEARRAMLAPAIPGGGRIARPVRCRTRAARPSALAEDLPADPPRLDADRLTGSRRGCQPDVPGRAAEAVDRREDPQYGRPRADAGPEPRPQDSDRWRRAGGARPHGRRRRPPGR